MRGQHGIDCHCDFGDFPPSVLFDAALQTALSLSLELLSNGRKGSGRVVANLSFVAGMLSNRPGGPPLADEERELSIRPYAWRWWERHPQPSTQEEGKRLEARDGDISEPASRCGG